MNTTTQPGPLEVRLSDQLGLAVNRALFDPACQRLNEWALIGPVQRAALESFAERLLAAERERCASICDALARVGDSRDSAACAAAIRGHAGPLVRPNAEVTGLGRNRSSDD